jgi:hypothetical protein
MIEETIAISKAGIPLVRGRSTVQSCAAAPENPIDIRVFDVSPKPILAVIGRTSPEHDATSRGKSVDFVRLPFPTRAAP